MLGLAGIGLFYLRLHDPGVPSVLHICEANRTGDRRAASHDGPRRQPERIIDQVGERR